MSYQQSSSATSQDTSLFSSSNAMSRVIGFSFLTNVLHGLLNNPNAMGAGAGGLGRPNNYLYDSLKLFMLGWIIEGGRRVFAWAIERFKPIQYSVVAQFTEGDPAYEWITLLLTEEQLWDRSRHFRVNAILPFRSWSVKLEPKKHKLKSDSEEHVDYVPTYDQPQLFKWKGYLVQVSQSLQGYTYYDPSERSRKRLYLTMYTRDMSALSVMVEEARKRYLKSSRPHVIVHTADLKTYGFDSPWNGTKRKSRRPLSSIVLQEGILDSLVDDAKEFIATEEWYNEAGIPHRRGYLLYGPPGTGKTSTIYAIAGELGLEIYSLSLGSSFVDDEFLTRAVASIPKQAILLIEDIDCAFPSRDGFEDSDSEDDDASPWQESMGYPGMRRRPGAKRSAVTLSGLLNVLDGVGSEEGRLFFATTNYVDHLDPALVRPGRIDKKIQYKLSTKEQAVALFLRFYPEAFVTLQSDKSSTYGSSTLASSKKRAILHTLAEQFASAVPEHEFSTAELQGFLLSCKRDPERAVAEVEKWIEKERNEKAERQRRGEERRARISEKKEAMEAKKLQKGLAKLGVNVENADTESAGPSPSSIPPESRPVSAGTQALATNDTFSQSSTADAASVSSESMLLNVASESGVTNPSASPLPLTKPRINGKHTAVDDWEGSDTASAN